nr:RNA-dependent RNA polymerase [Amarillovirales sp.]
MHDQPLDSDGLSFNPWVVSWIISIIGCWFTIAPVLPRITAMWFALLFHKVTTPIFLIKLALAYAKPKVKEHAAPVIVRGPKEEEDEIDDFNISCRAWKEALHDLNPSQFLFYKMHDVQPTEEREPSRGYGRLKSFIKAGFLGTKYDTVMEFGAGRGGWTKAITEHVSFNNYRAYSKWGQKNQEVCMFFHPKVERFPTHVESLKFYHRVDLLLSDMGEVPRDYDKMEAAGVSIVKMLDPWMMCQPKSFVIRIPNVFNETVLAYLERWQRLNGQGELVRMADERNSVPTMYFVSTNHMSDVRKSAEGLFRKYQDIMVMAKEFKGRIVIQKKQERTEGIDHEWEKPMSVPVPKLPMLDLSLNIPKLRLPVRTTRFLKELGWKPSSFKGSRGTMRNHVVYECIKGITSLLADYGLWRTTSTTPESTYATVLSKVDKSPKENHQHHPRIWECYQAISDFIRKKGGRMRYLSDDEIRFGVNKKGAMGFQEADPIEGKTYHNMGEYIEDPHVWKPRLKRFQQKLAEGKPENIAYNSIGKKERKQKDSSRLIWFMPATARIHETYVFGHLDTLLKTLPQSVSGIPLYDYGEKISKVMTAGKTAVCDDVAGWDTKISYSLLCQECEFIKSISPSKMHKDIEDLYRLYAYPLVWITRPHSGEVQDVLYQLQGQVASGRRVTYPMNTITNMAVTAARASFSQGIDVDQVRTWFLRNLEEGHTEAYGGFISGDDSVIIMGPDNAKKFANEGAAFMNQIGMPRKDIDPDRPSDILHTMEAINFCSHSYARVAYKKDDGEKHLRWMPIRSAAEILAKASIPTKHYFSMEEQYAWARAQGLNMIVNYHHIPTVKKVAQMVLSATPHNISLEGTVSGWAHRSMPWITQGSVVDIINGCLFGDSTHYPSDYRIRSLSDLGRAPTHQLREFDIRRGKVYGEWASSMVKIVDSIKSYSNPSTGMKVGDNWRYTSWLDS